MTQLHTAGAVSLGPADMNWRGHLHERLPVAPGAIQGSSRDPAEELDHRSGRSSSLSARANSVLVVGGAFANIALYAALLAQSLSAGAVTMLVEDASLRARAEALGIRTVSSLGAEDRYEITVYAAMDLRLLRVAMGRAGPPRAAPCRGPLTTEPKTALYRSPPARPRTCRAPHRAPGPESA